MIDTIHNGDFTDQHWLLLIEDEGLNGLGRIRGYAVFNNEQDAHAFSPRALCYALELDTDDDDEGVQSEVMSYADFRASYGNRMPLTNRYLSDR
jgi:hypothetical protein